MAAALADAARRLAAVSDTPRLDAELLMAHALGATREALLLGGMREPPPAGFADLVGRRLAHEPIAYIIGRRDFWTVALEVSPAVLIPRPETETLMETALDHFGAPGPRHVLDLGTGSGALLCAALAQWPDATGLGIDTSVAALEVARANVVRLGLGGRGEVRLGGWDVAADGAAALVLCNPPYVPLGETLPPEVAEHEPASALFAGADGLDDLRRIAPLLRLPAGGLACVEIGASQGAAVSALFRSAGFATPLRRDLAGLDRCVAITPGA